MEKVVLAYSGGLDTSFCVKYLSEELHMEVHTALANTGGFSEEELKAVEEKAYALGAKSHANLDVSKEYYDKCIKYMVYGNVLRNKTQGIQYLLYDACTIRVVNRWTNRSTLVLG